MKFGTKAATGVAQVVGKGRGRGGDAEAAGTVSAKVIVRISGALPQLGTRDWDPGIAEVSCLAG